MCVCLCERERVCVCLRERQCVWVCVRERESIFIASISFTCMEENAFANGSYQYMFTEENTFGGAPCLFIILGNNTLWKQPVSVYAYRREYILRWCMSVCAHIRIYIWGGVCLLVLTEEYTFESGHYQFILVSKCSLYLWASVLCIRFTIIPPRLTDQCNFITVLIVTREPEQTTLLFWSAACGVTPHGLHTANRQ